MNTKKLALFAAAFSILLGLGLTSCKKVEPTEVTTESLIAKTSLKGLIKYAYMDGDHNTTNKAAKKASIVATIQKKTVVDGKDVYELFGAVSTKSKDDGTYALTLPLAVGDSYKVSIVVSLEETSAYKLDESKYAPSSSTVAFGGSADIEAAVAGMEYIKNIDCAAKGLVREGNK